ncbi:TPA: acyltransferase [Proteus mirabilis]|uniref:acyltransferase family protein n=1 Tax=Proteus mirabilis TaxID=584 RepID=UPI0029EC018B|nr:acyltransferase [Proteus mirabilis]
MQSKKFRADINGLRAIAVLSVMFFHFNQELVPGGFAGVDVFFVISGFLMTSIIFRGLESNNFSLWSFLKARARRIVPALITIILIVLALGYLFFEPLTYQLVGKHGFSSLLFISNITYANEAGYFDADSFSKLFLHTWSLSVEWQFYIVYPIILLILSKLLSISTLKKIVVISAIISFIFCIYLSSVNKTLSYFMIYTRGWEMLLGGIAFLFPLSTTDNKKRIIEIVGLILIITSFFIFSNSDNWPSYNALLPVFGAYLCILSNNKKTLLSNVIFQKIGLWSYSIYLIHWPFIVFLKKININISILIYLITTIFLAFIVYSFIEKRRKYGYGLMLLWILSICVSYYVSIDGVGSRVDEKYKLTNSEFHEKYYGGTNIESIGNIEEINNNKKKTIILVGDSFARQYANFFKESEYNLIYIFVDGCFSTENFQSVHGGEGHQAACRKRYNNMNKAIAENPNAIVIYSQNWDSYVVKNINNSNDEVSSTKILKNEILNIVSKYNNKFFIIGAVNGSMGYSLFECKAKNSMNLFNFNCQNEVKRRDIESNNILSDLSNNQENIQFINPNDYMCNDHSCSLSDDNGDFIYSDNDHLSIYGARFVGKEILKTISNHQ